MIRTIITVALATLLGFPLAAQAQTSAGTPATAQSAAAKSAQAADAVFRGWDKNTDGQLSREEFRAGWGKTLETVRARNALVQQFNKLDTNKDHALDGAEARKMTLMQQAGKNAPTLIQFDSNHSGKLEFAEYVKLVSALAAKEQPARSSRK